MDEPARKLERKAQTGDRDAERELLILRVGRMRVEVPVDCALLKIMPLGYIDGQQLYEKDGETFPVLRWKIYTNSNSPVLRHGDVALFDLQTHALVHIEQEHSFTRPMTISLQEHPELRDHQMDAIRYATMASTMASQMVRARPLYFPDEANAD